MAKSYQILIIYTKKSERNASPINPHPVDYYPHPSLNVESLVISFNACGASNLAATATIWEVKKCIRQLIDEKKKKIRKPEIVSPVDVDRILAELEILQMVMAEKYDIGRRKELAREYDQRKKVSG